MRPLPNRPPAPSVLHSPPPLIGSNAPLANDRPLRPDVPRARRLRGRDADPCADRYANRYADSHTDGHSNTHANTYSCANPDTGSYPHAYACAHRNPVSDCYAYRDAHATVSQCLAGVVRELPTGRQRT